MHWTTLLAAEWRKTRRELYMTFLAGLAQARSELLTLSKKDGLAEDDRDETARQLFARCYEPRHHLELVAPPEVSEPALAYFRSVREVRNLVAAGKGVNDPEWEHHAKQVKRALGTRAVRPRRQPGVLSTLWVVPTLAHFR